MNDELVRKIRSGNVYVIYCMGTNMPYVQSDGSFFLFTNKAHCEENVKGQEDWLNVVEILPERLDYFFATCYCTGYQAVIIDASMKVPLGEVYNIMPNEKYGQISIEACGRMIDYKQNLSSIRAKCKKDGRPMNQEENIFLSKMSYATSQCLLKSKLIVPAEQQDGKLSGISIPTIRFTDNSKFIGLFTDYGALTTYFRKDMPNVVIPDLIKDQYERIKKDFDLEGIVINPGREEYVLLRGMLKELFGE